MAESRKIKKGDQVSWRAYWDDGEGPIESSQHFLAQRSGCNPQFEGHAVIASVHLNHHPFANARNGHGGGQVAREQGRTCASL